MMRQSIAEIPTLPETPGKSLSSNFGNRSETSAIDTYNLFYLSGVIAHIGGINKEHYLSYMKPNCKSSWWYVADDRTVCTVRERGLPGKRFETRTTLSKISDRDKVQAAYMLFYRRISPATTETPEIQLSSYRKELVLSLCSSLESDNDLNKKPEEKKRLIQTKLVFKTPDHA